MNGISKIEKNIMGTVSFDGKFQGMKKPQDFIVYPMQDAGVIIKIQSDTRMGQINLDTGEVTLSKARPNGAGFAALSIDVAVGRATKDQLSAEEIETLKGWIRSTGGLLVGNSIVKSDNTGALAV